MGVEKESSKGGGGYVGGFFQLFDWKAKSRKKLFSSKLDLPEHSKQGKRSDGNLPMTRLNLMDVDENGVGSSIRGNSDFSCASSVTDDDGYTARAPGVVARLMGLDSMPTSSFAEPSSTPFFDTQSLREVSHRRKNFDSYQEHQVMYSGNLLNKEEYPSRTLVESKPQKVLSRPIEKFQTEVLPPKSAKSIPITHHKLLSPIKSPGFIPSKTAAHIMEAAARIIEASPQGTAKAKMSIVGSSSVPLKVRDFRGRLEIAQKMPAAGSSTVPLNVQDLKEKAENANKSSRLAEASRRPVGSNAAKYLKGQSLNKSWNGSVDTSFSAFPDSEEGSNSKNKGKSISLAIQAKVNVQRREGLTSSSSRGLGGQKEQSQVASSESYKSQPNIQKSLHKKSTSNHSSILRQNNQKQNCPMDKDKFSSKPLVSNLQGRKVLSGNASFVRQKTSGRTVGSKTGSRKLGLDVMDIEKESTNHSTKNIPRKKRLIDNNLHVEKTQVADNMLIDNSRKTESNPVLDSNFHRAEESKKKGMDVVSFTFTAPLTRSMHGSETPGHIVEKNSSACMDNRGKRLLLDSDSMKLSSVGYNVIGGDALSTLLEQKLRELTKSVESSLCNNVKEGSASHSASVLQDLALPPGEAVPQLFNNKDQNASFVEKFGSSYNSNLFSTDSSSFRSKHNFQGVDEMAECGSKLNDSRKSLDHRRPSPISVLEPSFSTESSSSFDSMDSSCTEGSKHCSSMQAQETLGFTSSKKFHYVDADMDLSDSASSTSTGTMAKRHTNSLAMTDPARETNWEVDYIKKMLCNLELMFQDFALGQTCESINTHLFNQLESKKFRLESDGMEARLERKVLFDCVNECLEMRRRTYASGGYRTWVKGTTMVRRKEWLVEELHREILAWRDMGDCMVDELVDKDMSSQYGRWQDFEVDAFVLGAKIESQIFGSLVDEVVADICQ